MLLLFFTIFQVVLEIHRGVLVMATEWKQGGMPLSRRGSRLPLYLSNRAAPPSTDVRAGLLHKILLVGGFPSISEFEVSLVVSHNYFKHFACVAIQFFYSLSNIMDNFVHMCIIQSIKLYKNIN